MLSLAIPMYDAALLWLLSFVQARCSVVVFTSLAVCAAKGSCAGGASLVHAWSLTQAVYQALEKLEPSLLLSQLLRISATTGFCYKNYHVRDCEDRELARARLAVYEAARIVLGNGMRLLGLTPIERF